MCVGKEIDRERREEEDSVPAWEGREERHAGKAHTPAHPASTSSSCSLPRNLPKSAIRQAGVRWHLHEDRQEECSSVLSIVDAFSLVCLAASCAKEKGWWCAAAEAGSIQQGLFLLEMGRAEVWGKDEREQGRSPPPHPGQNQPNPN